MHRYAHRGHRAGQSQHFLLRRQQDQHLVYPVLPDPVIGSGIIRNDLQRSLDPFGQGIRQDQPRHPVAIPVSILDPLAQLSHIRGSSNDQQRASVFRNDPLLVIPLVAHTHQIAEAKVGHTGIAEILPGIEVRHLHHKQHHSLCGEHRRRILDRGIELPQKPPLQHAIHGAEKDDHHKIHQRQAKQQHQILRASGKLKIRGNVNIVGDDL